MMHIVISDNQNNAESYCKRTDLPPEDTVIIMFSGELSPFLMRAKNNHTPATVHNLNDKYKYIAKQFEKIV